MRLGLMDEEAFAISKNMVKKVIMVVMILMTMFVVDGADTNDVYSPCYDAKVQKGDGFSFGIVFSDKDSFFLNQGPQLSPCDRRLGLAGKGAELAIFRPKVDEISLLTISPNSSDSAKSGGFMVAFAGRQYAARSPPIMFSDNTYTITSFTLVLEFQEGRLENLYWKNFGCDGCSGGSVCLNNQDCAVPNSKCENNVCNIGIQLVFSGTDKNLNVLDSWYQAIKLGQYSLYGLFSDLGDSIITL